MRPSEEPLDEAERLARELAEYGDDDEVTANVHLHLPQPSVHDSDPPEKKLRGAALALGIGIGTALLTGLAALVQQCGHR